MKFSTAMTGVCLLLIACPLWASSVDKSLDYQNVPAELVSSSDDFGDRAATTSNRRKNKRKGKKGGKPQGETLRVNGEMRATVSIPEGVFETAGLGSDAIMFFEDAVQQALEETTEDDLHVRFVFVEDVSDSSKGNKKNKKHKKKRKGGRHLAAETVVPEGNPGEDASGHLRGHRALYKLYSLPGANGYWFNIWAYISLSCRFCETHDYASESSSSSDEIFYGDDDYYRPSSSSSASLDTEYADDDDFYDFYTRGRNGGHRLLEDASGFSADFQDRLCEILSEGPIEVFRGAMDCQTLFAWN
jgi:hypothetical protein